jgi:mono/diheme cytochrome c family protein
MDIQSWRDTVTKLAFIVASTKKFLRGRIAVVTSSSLIAVILIRSCLPAFAQEIGDVSAGRRLAENWCSSCHVVGAATQHGSANGVPTFPAIAAMKSTTPMALRVFLQTPHGQMPDLHLSRDEIDNLAAYILSLRR